ncbi:winged helix-turn-helix domain-containing protein [Rhodopseudomonas palustris]|uniref:winged helix-turn-helix domain-containing protein n=1 Tax=Rhodopseudomonas palustris TaxID=1076 RepID=UPI000CECCA3F|nr:winged helix-turn-helix domain-containing protein [Rhodopseudomonas palustris]PPQ42131.1 hypothetical protein CKO39_18245 [Rhodopseudomonas palustris]
MPFEPILPLPNRTDAPAVLSLRWRKDRLFCSLTFRKALCDLASLADGSKAAVLIGTGEDEGRLQVRPDASGPYQLRAVRAGSLKFEFPALKAVFGGEPREAEAIAATWSADDLAIVVELPDCGGGQKRAPATKAKPAAISAPAPEDAPERPSATMVSVCGIWFDVASGKERIIRNDERIECSARGLKLVRLLAKAFPNPVSDTEIIGALWAVKPHGVATQLDLVIKDLRSLKKLGLGIETVRGKGFRLVKETP